MRRSITTLAATVLVGMSSMSSPQAAEARQVMLYKNPQCGCCEKYADYLRQNDFSVTVQPTQELTAMSRRAGIPKDQQGCHLSMIDGYAVSGHVPVGAIRKLLTERPDITGVTLPGMPFGSPGMGSGRKEPFEILEVSKPGKIGGVYTRE